MEKIKIEYSNMIRNKKELLDQIRSIRDEALNNSYYGEIFKKDYFALTMAIAIIKKVVEE